MKATKYLIFTLLFCGLSLNVDAQFLKDLKKQVVDRSKNAIINKTADKVADNISDKVSDQISGSINNVLGANWGDLMGPIGNVKDIESLPDSYIFDYIYSLNMTSNEGEIPIDYYLNKSKPYMGAEFKMNGGMTMVFDNENNAMITLVGGRAIATEIPTIDIKDVDIPEEGEYKIVNLPNKTFLGYDCVGRLVEDDESKITIYIAQNTEMSFADMFKSNHIKIPKQMKLTPINDMNGMNGMLMYAEVVDKTNKGSKAILECVAFNKTDKTIKIR